jgi:hypothetical protein
MAQPAGWRRSDEDTPVVARLADSDFKPGTYWSDDLCTMLMERSAQHGGRRVQLVSRAPAPSALAGVNHISD